MNPTRCSPLLVLPLLAVGCGGGAKLSDLPNRTVLITADLGGSTSLTAILGYDHDPSNCDMLGDVTASLDGQALEVFSAGGAHETADGNTACELPRFVQSSADRLPSADAASPTLSIADSSQTIRVQVDHLMTPRTLQLQTLDGKLHAGQAATVTVSPPIESLTTPDLRFTPDDTSKPPVDLILASGSAAADGTLNVTVPQDAPLGSGTLTLLADVHPKVLACDGAVRCEVDLLAPVAVATNIAQ